MRPNGLQKAIILALSALLFLYSLYLYWRTDAERIGPVELSPLKERQTLLWRQLHSLLEGHAPKCPSPERQDSSGAIGFNALEGATRPDLIINADHIEQPMQEAHDAFVYAIKNSNLNRAYSRGTSGIVSSAGKSYLPLFVTSLRMLRRTGSTLPVELFVKDASEYEIKICEDILPEYNAKCIILSDILAGQGKSMVEIAHYQIKIFAVLFSSFENVIWMDSDGFPLYKPETLLQAEPFTATGLVTWPDFWASTASPLYYNISRQPVPPMTERASSETGVFLISKNTHFLTMLLAAYYNYYGPSHYFMLLSQGGPGEGDKETFIQAAAAISEPFYTVSERVSAIGHEKPEGGISGSAMVQADPIEDYRLTSEGKWRVKNQSVAKAPRVFFVHAHYPKFNPAENLFGNEWETAPTLKQDGSLGRAWVVPEETLRRFGYDAEKGYWEEIKWVSCSLEHVFESWKGKSGICHRVEEYWRNVFDNPEEDVPTFSD
ncbi:alpha-mannosyltransferase [Aspergillus alliaceus]|uniref:alpha-mannosyltransferase n=1 Tax=Petromyces alliaceus TaxID=209559 RepID=UPI0012A57158|nr:mannosyltransferase putative-domain-containing protein [Aspergillus alliaceus]KAB8238722.1 mannosyltransferase putative-domain-containing protein [Aspergillus alliaceus]